MVISRTQTLIQPIIVGVTTLLVFIVSAFLLYLMIDGAPVIEQAELEAGRKLTCEELYYEPTIENYYSVHDSRGHVLYLFNFFAFLWIPFLGFMGVMFARTFWRLRWVTGAATTSLIILIFLYLPVVGKIGCALE